MLRRQNRRDTWPIHQLYTRVTPRHVSAGRAAPRRELAAAADQTAASAGASAVGCLARMTGSTYRFTPCTGPRAHVLRPMLDPASREHAPAVLRYAISQLHEPRTVFAVLRGYQSELGERAVPSLAFGNAANKRCLSSRLAIQQRQTAHVPLLRRSPPWSRSIPTATDPELGEEPYEPYARTGRHQQHRPFARYLTATYPPPARTTDPRRDDLIEIVMDLGRLPEARFREAEERFLSRPRGHARRSRLCRRAHRAIRRR